MLHSLIGLADAGVSAAQTQLFEHLLQPAMYALGWMDYDEDCYDALYWFIIAICEIVAMYAVLRPLEALWPAERWESRRAVRVDVFYTWITRLGVINVLFFFLLQPLFDAAQGALRFYGLHNIDLDSGFDLIGIPDAMFGLGRSLLSFVIYLVVLDFAGYWYHRWQHRFGWWWELHALHHSQRQMSLWSDDRNHLIDTLLEGCFFAALALLIGVQPSQYVVLIAASQVVQSMQHANIRLPQGWPLWNGLRHSAARVLVSPTFHRRHHAIGYGHEGVWYGCNFGVLFPWWDMIFGTASWDSGAVSTGIRDQLPQPHGLARDYGEGFWAQQIRAISRAAGRARGWAKAWGVRVTRTTPR